MIYLDNAATTLPKPSEVCEAVVDAMNTFGGVGRGVHEASLRAGMTVFEARAQLAKLFCAPSPASVVLSANATAALNTAICGLTHSRDHLITTAASHNSVLRPLYRAQQQGCTLSILPVAPDGCIDYEAFDALFASATRMAILTHASNVTGDVYDIARMAAICHEHDALCVVDAAQTAGIMPIDMAESGIDVLVFTGHKSLFGPQGTGGMCIAEGVDIRPLMVGGSGTHSFDHEHPSVLPESLEAGTLNSHGIAGLLAGVTYITEQGVETLGQSVQKLTAYFEERASAIDGVTIYGGRSEFARCGIVALNIEGQDSALISDMLNTDFGICTRPGAHCAPMMHQALGSAESGLVRFSFSHLNTREELDRALDALAYLAEKLQSGETDENVQPW